VITHSIEIDRGPEEVFAYLDQPERHGEWQSQIVSARVEGEGPVGVGTRVQEIRKIGNREQDTSYEITERDPPRRSSFRGIAGPVRPVGTVIVEAIGDGSRSRVTLEFDLVGQGMMGKLIAPMARSQARKSIPESQEQLKAKLETGV
jgi:carbon monoxide dehydrogenase subunit G